MNNGLKIQRCNFLPEGEMAIIKDTNTLIHNIVDSELKEKDKEIERLNNIIDELEKWCDIQFQVYKDLDKIQDSRISCHYLRMKDKLKALKEGKE